MILKIWLIQTHKTFLMIIKNLKKGRFYWGESKSNPIEDIRDAAEIIRNRDS